MTTATSDATTAQTCVVLRIGTGRYAIDAEAVAEVASMFALTRLPDAPGWIAGVANWRGRVLPVLDLRPLLGVASTALASSARVLVLVRGPVRVGILSDSVSEVTELDLGAAAALPTAAAPMVSTLVNAQVIDDVGPIALLDADAILGLARLLHPE